MSECNVSTTEFSLCSFKTGNYYNEWKMPCVSTVLWHTTFLFETTLLGIVTQIRALSNSHGPLIPLSFFPTIKVSCKHQYLFSKNFTFLGICAHRLLNFLHNRKKKKKKLPTSRPFKELSKCLKMFLWKQKPIPYFYTETMNTSPTLCISEILQ